MGQDRIFQTFKEMVAIDSESKEEGKFHDYLIALLQSLGMETVEDNSKESTGLGANNLIARLRGNADAEPMFFSCHTDTVTPGKGIVAVLKDGVVYSEGQTILAADDKAGIAILVEALQRIEEQGIPHGTIELVLTPGEEIGLLGSTALDESLMEADFGFVLDSGGPVGGMVVGSPNLYSINFTVKGKAAHAGLEPEKGVSAIAIAAKAIAGMRLGRIDAETTANIGVIQGGAASNIVAEEVEVKAEARSISDLKIEEQLRHMIGCFEEAAAEMGGEVSHEKKLLSKGYHLNESNRTVKLALEAVKSTGREPRLEIIGGGSDANALYAKGKEALNLSIGYGKVHTVDEYIPIDEMEKAVELLLAIVSGHAAGK